MLLRQSTDNQQIALGPIMQWDDDDESLVPYTGTVANTDIRILKAGATSEVSKSSGGATHVAGGMYRAVLSSSDTDTLGLLKIRVAITGTLPVTAEATIVPTAVYDALVAGAGNGIRAAIAQATIDAIRDGLATSDSVEGIPAAVLAAATDAGGIAANAVAVDGEPMVPLGYEVAKESSMQDILEAVNGLDGPGAPTGPGGIPVIIPVTSNNQPVDGAAVWITTDPEGTNQIAGVLYTNTFGNTDPAFTLEAGIFYVWVQKAGINFPNPQVIEVLENGTYQWYTG